MATIKRKRHTAGAQRKRKLKGGRRRGKAKKRQARIVRRTSSRDSKTRGKKTRLAKRRGQAISSARKGRGRRQTQKLLKRRIALFLTGVVWLALTFIPNVFKKSSIRQESSSPERIVYVDSGEQFTQLTTSFSQEPVEVDHKLLEKPKRQGKPPKQIIIPSIQIDLEISQSEIVNGYWEVFPDRAGFGKGSAYPGEVGNQVIFAHARERLFLDLAKVNLGDTVYVLGERKWYKYTVTEKKEVAPDQVEVIAPTPDETLTLYTCSGFADSKRLIVVAKRTA